MFTEHSPDWLAKFLPGSGVQTHISTTEIPSVHPQTNKGMICLPFGLMGVFRYQNTASQ